VALLIIEHISVADNKVVDHYLGTAFFISRKLLLTAGHNVHGPPNVKVKVRITIAGTPYINYAAVQRNDVLTFDCKVVHTLYKNPDGPSHYDIAILDARGVNAISYLKLSTELPVVSSKVNVLGYPGQVKQEWLLCHESIKDVQISRGTADEMFPTQRMTITSGPVETVGPTISYKLSTIPGMSGGCVLHDGQAIGIPVIALSNNVGVHVGQHFEKLPDGRKVFSPTIFPMAVSFTSPKVLEFLRKYTQGNKELEYLK
jgi:V8-like Glu-specific endopeptidase